jgi:hypothetical protein
MMYLHANNFIHASLKTKNIFLVKYSKEEDNDSFDNVLVKDYGFLNLKLEGNIFLLGTDKL